MRFVIAGGSGFIGQRLKEVLLSSKHDVMILTRKNIPNEKNVQYVQWLTDGATPENEIKHADVFINLAGVSINDGRWSTTNQKKIYESRMMATDELVRIIATLPKKTSTFINASAIGIYPASLKKEYTENSPEIANDFLGKTVHDWEQKASVVDSFGIRPVFMRFGVVLGKGEGALPLMVLPYKLFAGGTVGSGNQWVSWVHVEDVVRAIEFAAMNEQLRGPVNVTAPTPVTMKEFGKTIGSVLGRPHWMPVPSFTMKIVLGKKSALVLEGQHVTPNVLLKNGFEFKYSSLTEALKGLLIKE